MTTTFALARRLAPGLMVAVALLPSVGYAEDEGHRMRDRLRQVEREIDEAAERGLDRELDELKHLRQQLMHQLQRMDARRPHHRPAAEPDAERRMDRESRELELHRQRLELGLIESEAMKNRTAILMEPVAASLAAVDTAAERLEPEEAIEFLTDLLEDDDALGGEARDHAETRGVRVRIRQVLAELSFRIDRREQGMQHLRALITGRP